MQELERKLGYRFRSGALLAEALRHSSYANEHRGAESVSNERLEFLGDSVLGFVTAEYLFARHPDSPEGELTRIRAALVCEESLHEVAQKLELGRYLKLGNGEEAGGGRTRPSILADATEAVIAAVYLDGGLAAASSLIHRVLLDCEREEVVEERRRDYKTVLQELVQREPNRTLVYRMAEESGPDHDKTFTFEVLLNGAVVGRGEGHSKKEAEQMAARAALENDRRACPAVFLYITSNSYWNFLPVRAILIPYLYFCVKERECYDLAFRHHHGTGARHRRISAHLVLGPSGHCRASAEYAGGLGDPAVLRRAAAPRHAGGCVHRLLG